MSTVQEIEAAIDHLSLEERAAAARTKAADWAHPRSQLSVSAVKAGEFLSSNSTM
jgi:outer membrane murein-binding lipoprotein Lpp